ncbi:MAG TPA: nuclear transport factor 2 family protein [Terriglobales bacterium]|nr:nuclear transport factor 2 family protein [Terriglobales bacterium]
MLKRLSAAVVLMAVLSSCTMWKNPPKGWAGATGGEQLERLLWEEIRTKNWAELGKHLEPNFVYTSANERRDKTASIERWKQFELQSVNLAEVQVQTAGADFIVTATLTVTGTVDGKPISPEPVRSMTVWQQVGANWVAVAHADFLP